MLGGEKKAKKPKTKRPKSKSKSKSKKTKGGKRGKKTTLGGVKHHR